MNTIYYHFVRICNFFAHFTYVIAKSTGCNPTYTRRYKYEWQQWERYLEILDIQRRNI